MEKLTISRIGQEKVVNYTNKKTGQPDSFKKIGIQTNEYGDRWFDVTYRNEVPVKVGQSYDFEISSREYNGKTYYEAKLPREGRAAGLSENDKAGIQQAKTEAYAARMGVQLLRQELEAAGVLAPRAPVVPGTNVAYPSGPVGPTAFDESTAGMEDWPEAQ